MAKVSELTGTPWHLEKLTRGEGDERRHKSRCIYYRKPDSYCKYQYITCTGSRYCKYYKAKEIEETPQYADTPVNTKEVIEKITDAEGMKLFPLGSKVQHQKFGDGLVTDISDSHITIDFDEAGERILGLDVCVAKGYLKVIELPVIHEVEVTDVNEAVAASDNTIEQTQSEEPITDKKNKFGWLGKLLSGLFKRGK